MGAFLLDGMRLGGWASIQPREAVSPEPPRECPEPSSAPALACEMRSKDCVSEVGGGQHCSWALLLAGSALNDPVGLLDGRLVHKHRVLCVAWLQRVLFLVLVGCRGTEARMGKGHRPVRRTILWGVGGFSFDPAGATTHPFVHVHTPGFLVRKFSGFIEARWMEERQGGKKEQDKWSRRCHSGWGSRQGSGGPGVSGV